MQDFSIIRESQIKETFRTNAIKGKFDLDIPVVSEKFEGKINIPETWNIGLVVGNSGAGKTTIAKEQFGGNFIESFGYDNGSVVDKMPKKVSVNEITKIFNSVGFSSVPSWLKPYHVLSNGEKMRVDLARAILEDRPFMIDTVAKHIILTGFRYVATTSSIAIANYRKKRKEWKCTRIGRHQNRGSKSQFKNFNQRITTSWEYIM